MISLDLKMLNLDAMHDGNIPSEWKETITGVFELAKHDTELEASLIEYAKTALYCRTNIYTVLYDMWVEDGENFLEEERMSKKITSP